MKQLHALIERMNGTRSPWAAGSHPFAAAANNPHHAGVTSVQRKAPASFSIRTTFANP